MGCGASRSAPVQLHTADKVDGNPTVALENQEDPDTKRLREVFGLIDKDRSGAIDIKEFLLTAKSGDSQNSLTQIFEYLDSQVQTDGMISEKEWIIGLKKLYASAADLDKAVKSITQSLAAAAMSGHAYDSAAGSSNSRDEKQYEAAFKSLGGIQRPSFSITPQRPGERMELLHRVFTAMDVDGDGSVDLAEYKRSARTASEAEEDLTILFEFVLDTSGDGKLSFEEWAKGMDRLRPDDGTEDCRDTFNKEMLAMLETLSTANGSRAVEAAVDAASAPTLSTTDAPAGAAPA